MEIVKDLVVVLHFVGLASLLGGFLVQMSARVKQVNPAMLHGALTQLVTGIVLVGLAEVLNPERVNHLKLGVKGAVLLVIVGLILRFRGRDQVPVGVWGAIGGLTLVEILVAVLW